jgi:hypothetical protein
MTKLEELKDAWDAACAACADYDATDAAWAAAWDAMKVAHTAYQEELNKIKGEITND